MSPYIPGDNKFCVVCSSAYGLHPSFWPTIESALDLIAQYCNSKCADGVSVWRRRTPKSPWKLITRTK